MKLYKVESNSLTVNVGELATGSELTWDVYAMQGDEELCRTSRSATLTKQAAEVQEVVETEDAEEDKKKKDKKPEEPTEETEDCDPYDDDCIIPN